MKKIISVIALLLLMLKEADAQTNSAITGKWKFREVYDARTMDSVGAKMITRIFKNLTLYLRADGHYKATILAREQGLWAYDTASGKLTMAADKGTIAEPEFRLLTDETSLFSFGKGKSIVLVRSVPDTGDAIMETGKRHVLVSAKPEQLLRKWYLMSRIVPGRTPEQAKLVTDLVAGAFFQFKVDNTYTAKILTMDVSGIWTLYNGGKTILLVADNEKKFWNIVKISDTELVLERGNTGETWLFSTLKQ